MSAGLVPRHFGPYVVCDCIGKQVVESLAKDVIEASKKPDRIYRGDGTLASTLVGGENYIIGTFVSQPLPETLVPKFIGAVQARIGRMYNPDGPQDRADAIGADIENRIEAFHNGAFYEKLVHRFVPGMNHFIIVGMTRDNKKNRNPDPYFAEFTENVTEILVNLSKTYETPMYV